MPLFVETSLSFPTVMLSFLLCIAILYWAVVACGLLEIDLLDTDITQSDSGMSSAEGIGGLLLKLGLKDVPVTLLLTLLIFFAWIICYFLELLLLRFVPLGVMRYPLGAVVVFGALFLAVLPTRAMSSPLRPLFRKFHGNTSTSVLGRTVVVRSGKVSSTQGEAVFDDGGAGLILRIRADETLGFKRGDRLVLLEYLEPDHAYRVITEEEFNGI